METDRRTVVASGVPDALPPDRMADKLTIHFQSGRRSRGGDVEVVEYPTNLDGVAFVTFEKAEDAERVLRKERHIMTDSEFPEDYNLTVFPFSRDVFFYVSSATVNLSIFGSDQVTLIESLRSAHRSIRIRPLPQEGKAFIEGPFSAVRALREDLIRRASHLKSTVSVQKCGVKLRETPPNPRVISPPVSYSLSKAEREPLGSSSLSTPLQSIGKASEVQRQLSKAKAQTSPSRQKLSDESVAGGSFLDNDENGARSRLEMPSEYRREQTKASHRRVVREGVNAGIISSLSGLDLHHAGEISAKQPEGERVSQKHTRADGVSENHLDSHYSSTDFMQDLSSSAVSRPILQTGLSTYTENNTESKGDLSAVYPEDLEDLWVDSCTFRYIQKFRKNELDRCLRGCDASIKSVEGSDFMRIVLTERHTSKATSRLKHSLEHLKALMDLWQSILRVHEVFYNKAEFPDKRELAQICEDQNLLFGDILYMFEDSCIKVIGPSVSSYLFCKGVKKRMARLEETVSKSLKVKE